MFIFPTLCDYGSNAFICSIKTLIMKMRMLHLQVGPEPDQGGTRAQAPSAWLQLERKLGNTWQFNNMSKIITKMKKPQFHIVTFKSSQRLQTGNGGEHDVVNAELHIYAVTGAAHQRAASLGNFKYCKDRNRNRNHPWSCDTFHSLHELFML